MDTSPLLAPVVALVAWSLVMLIWLAIARAPFVKGRLPDGARGADVERAHPGKPNWPAHNYMHLMEQPTLFYAIVFALILMRLDVPINVYLAWCYVSLRVVHSIVQSTVNIVRLRFTIFTLATVCLVALTLHAGMFIFRH